MCESDAEDLDLGKSIPALSMRGSLGDADAELVTEEVVPQDQAVSQDLQDGGRPDLQKETPSLDLEGKNPLD